jgi:hypothetical protein
LADLDQTRTWRIWVESAATEKQCVDCQLMKKKALSLYSETFCKQQVVGVKSVEKYSEGNV